VRKKQHIDHIDPWTPAFPAPRVAAADPRDCRGTTEGRLHRDRHLAEGHGQAHVAESELFYIVLGCFSLDWDGLDLTRERGYRTAAQRTIDGRSFTPWAKEKGVEVSLRGLYRGSHNQERTDVTLTTFGDHHALPRFGLPDLLWNSGEAFRRYGDVPEAREVMAAWHEANYETLRERLSDLTPGRNGVPLERVYTEVWHFVFAIADRTLVERGFFADPYDESRAFEGFLPATWANGLDEPG